MKIKILLTCLLGTALLGNTGVPSPNAPAETRYLAFQVQTGLPGYASQFHPPAGRFSLTKAQMEEFVRDVVKAIGMTGDARHKLAFAVGPLCFDMPDEETRQFIRDAFAVARENDVAVALHIDDSMGWGERKDLISNPDNIETADWKQIPNTGRRMDWGLKPMKFAPQMCFNAPAIIAAVKDRGALIGTEVKKEMDVLKAAGKEHLFAGLIAGWETRIGRDFDTDQPLGYRALSHRGFSESHPPKDADHERVLVVKEFIERWANALHAPGVPREKIYCHIAFTAQGLDRKEKTATVSTFALPEVAFSSGYRPGFSTYPSRLAFKEIWGHVAAHDSPAWISAEGTNVSPGGGMPSGITMETYLGRMFNHGAVLVNIFAWGIGGEAMRNHFFRRAAEAPEPLAAYGKFLRGEALVESTATGFSVEVLEAKVRRIQAELPGWMQQSGQQAQAMPLVQKMQALIKEKKWQGVDKAADEVLTLLNGTPAATKAETSTINPPQTPSSNTLPDAAVKRLAEKVERVKAGARQWAESGRDPSGIARTMEGKFKPLMEAGNLAEAEVELDRVLEQLKQDGKSTATPTDSTEAVHERIAAKIERVKQGVHQWADSGRDPSAILKTMQKKVGPLIEAGKFSEAEPELDRVLEQLKQDGESSESPTAPTEATHHATQDITEELRSKLTHNIGSTFLVFRAKVQGELKVTKEQKKKLDQHLQELLPDAMQALQKSKGERDNFNQQMHEEMAAVLKATLNESQRTRLHQLELQRDGLFGAEWNLNDLQITNRQRKQFMAPIQETQQKTQALMAELHKGANPDEIRPKILQLRLDLEGQLEALLMESQQKQWKDMLGPPVDLGVLFDGV